MNSPSRQWDFEPFEFPLTQFAYPPELGWPLRIETLPPPFAPAHCSRVGAAPPVPTAPLVHWLRLAEPLARAPWMYEAGRNTATATEKNAARNRRRCASTCHPLCKLRACAHRGPSWASPSRTPVAAHPSRTAGER